MINGAKLPVTFLHQIMDFILAPIQLVFNGTFPHPLYYTVAFDTGTEAKLQRVVMRATHKLYKLRTRPLCSSND